MSVSKNPGNQAKIQRTSLSTPASAAVPFPVATRLQELPIAEITWENFEKLCLRLIEKEVEVEQCQRYGQRGENQKGIDICARRRDQERYDVYQCKNVTRFGPKLIEGAVTTFLEGEWAARARHFVLCTRESMVGTQRADTIVTQTERLRAEQIAFTVWDSDYFVRSLKSHPDLVDDFFGREWVRTFCGEEAAQSLGTRLDVGMVAEYRQQLRIFYHHLFNTLDPGLPVYSLSAQKPLSLEERFITPDIYVQRSLSPLPAAQHFDQRNGDGQSASQEAVSRNSEILSYRQRQGLENRLVEGQRHVILAPVGRGKSTLLRFLALDQLAETPTLDRLTDKWGAFLPVWVPFSSWTRWSATTTGPCSLNAFLEQWFEGMDAKKLWPLVSKALSDDRLLLLVDGLDEYADEQTGRATLRQLEVFTARQSIPVIVTGRPEGFRRLEMQTAGWQISEIAELAPVQQQRIVYQWFLHRESLSPSSLAEEHERVQSLAKAQAEAFLIELGRVSALAELARTPLLLNLLISHRFFHAALPLTRTKAYESLVNLMLHEHPKRRREAVFSPEKSSVWTENDLMCSLASLAYAIQTTVPEGLVRADYVEKEVERYLRDEEIGCGYPLAEARSMSRSFLAQCTDEYGLLVKRSPSEVGFYHRTFQEYFAAYHLSRLPFPEPRDVLLPHLSDPRWREVILNFLQILNRPQEVKSCLDAFEQQVTNLDPVEQDELSVLMYEIAIGPYNCPPSRVHQLLDRAFMEVERGDRLSHRERILILLLEDTASVTTGAAVRARLMKWFPRQISDVGGLYAEMRSWPSLPEVDETLWQGIRSEQPDEQRSAAFALAERCKNDESMFVRMKHLAQRGESASVRATALLALHRGWSAHPELVDLAQSASISTGVELRLAGIYVKVQLGSHGDRDVEELLHIGKHLANVDYQWRYLFARGVLAGWPQDSRVKEACLESVMRQDRQQQVGIPELEAFEVLVEGFPQDDDIARLCAQHIEADRFSPLMHSTEHWRRLAINFQGHPVLVPVVEEWLSRQTPKSASIPNMSCGALLVRSLRVRDVLLTCLTEWCGHWASEALLEGWGMEDEAVSTALTKLALGSEEQAISHARFFPRIIPDADACRKRLLALFSNAYSPYECASVLTGLKELGETEGDSEVVDRLLPLLVSQKRSLFDPTREMLIGNYSTDPRVRTLALEEAASTDGCNATVASRYGADEEIRSILLKKMGFLPTALRRRIASQLGQLGQDAVVLPIFEQYRGDPDTEVRNSAAIGYHQCLKARGQSFESVSTELMETIAASGFDYQTRRQSALCGLLTWGHLEYLHQPDGEDMSNRTNFVQVHSLIHESPALAAHLAKNWRMVKDILGDQRWHALSNYGPEGRQYVCEVLGLFADEFDEARDDVLSLLEDGTSFEIHENHLTFLARVRPGSHPLLKHCLRALSIGESRSIEGNGQVIVAAQLLGEHFGGDPTVLKLLLEGKLLDLLHPGIVVALCEGWPESVELEEVYQRTKADGRARWDYSLTAYLGLGEQRNRNVR